MTATVTTHAPWRKPGLTEPLTKEDRRWQNGSRDPVAVYVAAKLLRGLRASTVEKLIRRLPEQAAAIIAGFDALSATERLARWKEPIDLALQRIQVPAFCLETVRKDSEADASRSVAEHVLLVAPTREHAIQFLRKSREARACAQELELAVAKKWELA